MGLDANFATFCRACKASSVAPAEEVADFDLPRTDVVEDDTVLSLIGAPPDGAFACLEGFIVIVAVAKGRARLTRTGRAP